MMKKLKYACYIFLIALGIYLMLTGQATDKLLL